MLPQLQAERQLAAIEAAAVPHMGDGPRREIVGRLQRRATPGARSTRSLAEALGARVVATPTPATRKVRK